MPAIIAFSYIHSFIHSNRIRLLNAIDKTLVNANKAPDRKKLPTIHCPITRYAEAYESVRLTQIIYIYL